MIFINSYWYKNRCSDVDVINFINATGITDATIISALCVLVTTLKNNGLWTKFDAIYPMVGGTATTHKFNLKNPADTNAAFRLFFSGGWTHSSTGALPNGTNSYADTFYNSSVNAIQNSHHLSYYSRTNTNLTQVEIGNQVTTNQNLIQIRTSTITYFVINQGSPYAIAADGTSLGHYIANRTASNLVNGWKNGVKVATSTTASNGRPNANIYIGAYNNNGVAAAYSTKQCAFATIGTGFTDAEALAFRNTVQTFQTSLSRQV